jgi:lipopolysaccharide export LptBFGC system permease protein LptF
MSLVLKRLLHPFFIISLILGIFSVVLANDIGVKIFEKSEEIRKEKREEKKEEVDGPMNIFLGALSPVMAVADVKGYQSWIVAIAIIILPIISMVMIREDNKVFEGIVIIIFPFLSASLIATNSSTSLFAGVGGILSPLILGVWIAGQLLNVARDEVKKEFGIETENMKKDRIKREEEQNKLLNEIANKK